MSSPQFNKNLATISLLDLLRWATGSDPESQLLLPVIQRESVWGPPRVLGLWHSVMAGMPIGALYLTSPTETARGFGSQNAGDAPRKTDYDLLDGQQRLRTLMLARRTPAEEQRCLWADAEIAELRLLMTTAAQPFGYNAEGNKLAVEARRKARHAWLTDSKMLRADGGMPDRSYDHEVFNIQIGVNGG